MVPRSAIGVTTHITPMPAPPTGIKGQSGSTAASSSALDPGTTGAGMVAAGTAIAPGTGIVVDMRPVEHTAAPLAADMQERRVVTAERRVVTAARHAVTAAEYAATAVAPAVTAAAEHTAASVAATRVAAATAAADTGKIYGFSHKGPSASAGGPFSLSSG